MVEKLQEKIEKVKEAVKRCGLDSECVGCPYENQHCSELDRDIITVIDCLEAKVPRWISAKEPPEEWKNDDRTLINYIVYIPECGIVVGNYMKQAKTWIYNGVPCKVTHWMPPPEAPKGGHDES